MKCNILLTGAITILAAWGCRSNASSQAEQSNDSTTAPMTAAASFDSDSAYRYIEDQLSFGPRVTGTEGNRQCAEYLTAELRRHGADNVRLQQGTIEAYTGDILPIENIMGSFNPSAKKRILLLAHYDTRPWADGDTNDESHNSPIPGANDGGSGVGVILEIARHLGKKAPEIGVDILFVDAEDYGQSSGFSTHDDTWALGTQYWVAHLPYSQDSLPAYAILLDMVGGVGAKFHREYYSSHFAPDIVDKVWSVAAQSGYGDRFINKDGGVVIDDHYYINKAGIPAIDIIESKNDQTKSFPATWHTMGDDITNIDRSSLKAAGQTVLNLIYNEK